MGQEEGEGGGAMNCNGVTVTRDARDCGQAIGTDAIMLGIPLCADENLLTTHKNLGIEMRERIATPAPPARIVR
jgi:hypothetical protein